MPRLSNNSLPLWLITIKLYMEIELKISKDSGQILAYEGNEQVGLIEFTIEGNTMSINHTRTFPDHEGKGIAGTMMEAINDYAVNHQLKVLPICSYAWAWYQKHPQFTDILDEHAGEGVSCQIGK